VETVIVHKIFDGSSLTDVSRDMKISSSRVGILFKRGILKIGTDIRFQNKKDEHLALWELSEHIFYQTAKNDSLFNAVRPHYRAYSKASGKKPPPPRHEVASLY
jgi:hypothetical protein